MLLHYCLALPIGACCGSFLSVCSYRIPRRESISFPASHCVKCEARLSWRDNCPLLSYLSLMGRCRHCGATISPRYFTLELVSALLACLALWCFGLNLIAAQQFMLWMLLLLLSTIDIELGILPDRCTLPGTCLGLLLSLLPGSLLTPWQSLAGALVGGGSLLALAFCYQKITGNDGVGGGDIKLMALLGAWLGWPALPFVLMVGSSLGVFYLVLPLVRGQLRRSLPFGPFLSLAALIYACAGDQIVTWYLQLLHF